eukprot:TRINITY_DN5084_c0_g3_i1.p1 TRINITY_DN5084_c0_g3~~TRINITY_DN5084_c0_g3_i1.p1  ORF type:complete len:102 (-),score=2.80 TRINITY_DN5084_c0_g3_i1:145-450(-)
MALHLRIFINCPQNSFSKKGFPCLEESARITLPLLSEHSSPKGFSCALDHSKQLILWLYRINVKINKGHCGAVRGGSSRRSDRVLVELKCVHVRNCKLISM